MTTKLTAADRLHRAAEWIREHPDHLVESIILRPDDGTLTLHATHYNPDESAVRAFMASCRPIVGNFEKAYDDHFLTVSATIMDGVQVKAAFWRDNVCTARVVGQKEVVLPAVEAKPARTIMQDVVEWDCGPLLERPDTPSRSITLEHSEDTHDTNDIPV